MDGRAIISLIVIGVVVYLVGYFLFYWKSGRLREDYERGYDEVRRPHLARQAAAGVKPWGKPMAGTAFGNAYFLDTEQVFKLGIAGPADDIFGLGPYLGAHQTNTKKGVQQARLYYPGDEHLLTVAPARKGKGISQVITNLITYDGSIFVIDVKGENSRKTAAWRDKQGQDVYVFQPFDPSGRTARFNPIDFIRPGPDAFDDAALLAEMIVVPTGNRDDDFWDSEARNVIAGFILHVALDIEDKKRKTLAEVRRLLTLNKLSFIDTLDDMGKSKNRSVRGTADNIQSMEERVKSSVLTTVKNKTAFLDSERLEAAITRSDWQFEDLKRRPTTVYIVIPPEYLISHRGIVRLMVGMAATAMSREPAKPKLPVLFLLDEFPQLGKMERIAAGIRILAGYGVRMWFFVQDLPALYAVYGHDLAKSFVANCGCKSFFGTNDLDTAKYLSEQLGNMGVIVEGQNHNGGGGIFDNNVTTSYSATGRPLLTPEEILTMPAERQLILISGQRPIFAFKEKYYEMEMLQEIVAEFDMTNA